MNHTHAAHLMLETADEKATQGVLGLRDGHAVQIDLALHSVLAAAQPSQHRGLNLRAMEYQLITPGELRVGALTTEALREHRRAVGAGEARVRACAGRSRYRAALPQGPDIAHGLAEQIRLIGLLAVRITIVW